jgi:hypothetical protein
MAVAQKDPTSLSGSLAEEVLDAVRSEPALAWFLAQGLWIAQPALEVFWPQDKIAAIADLLETKVDPVPDDTPLRDREESETRK